MTKKVTAIALMLILSLIIASTVIAAEFIAPIITLNGATLKTDVPPTIINDRTMVPLRAISEATGSDVYWIESERIVIIVKNETKILMQIGKAEMYKADADPATGAKGFFIALGNAHGETVILDVPPTIIQDRTMLPLRALCEALGLDVDWDEKNRTVILDCDEAIINNKNTDKTIYFEFAEMFDNKQ